MATYEIYINIDTSSSNKGKSPIAGNGATAESTTTSAAPSTGNIRQGVAKTLVAFNSYVKPFVNQIITQENTTIAMKTGAQELEDQMTLKTSLIQRGVGLVESAVIGGLVGNVPGAIIGVAMSLMTTAIDYSNKYEKLAIQRDVENVGLRFMNNRAGGSVASFSGSRLKNQ